MSCLPVDALSHFEQREQELLAVNAELERKRAHVVAGAASALEGATAIASAAATPQGVAAGISPATGTSPVARAPPIFAAAALADARLVEAPTEEVPKVEPAAAAETWARSRPPSAPGGSETLQHTVKLQNARIIGLQEELDKAHKALAARDSAVEELSQQGKGLSEDLAKLQRASSSTEKKYEALKSQASTAEARVKDLEREKADLQKEKSQMEVQLRRTEADASAKEARLNRLAEECERSKLALKDVGSHGKDQSASDRREIDRLQGEVRKLERQRSELVSAFKKQMKLIEVLKRQRAHMEAARVLSFTEEEFIRVLELGDRLGEK